MPLHAAGRPHELSQLEAHLSRARSPGEGAATHIEEIITALEALGWTVSRQFATRHGWGRGAGRELDDQGQRNRRHVAQPDCGPVFE